VEVVWKLVSALFPLSKSKHSMGEYSQWLTNFLGSVTTDVYFFTPPELEPLVRKARGKLPITIDTTFSSPFDIPPLVNHQYRYREMHSQDRERRIHSPELYAVWNGKPFYLDEAVKRSAVVGGKTYDYAFWNDAGSFRNGHAYMNWPDRRRIEDLWEEGSKLIGAKKEDVLFFPICGVPHDSMRFWQEAMGPIDNEVSEASFFGGSPQTVSWWRSTYYAYHDAYITQNIFVGKDQTLINALFLLFPQRLMTVWFWDPDAPSHITPPVHHEEGALGACGETWFYYQFWLAGITERALMRNMWDYRAKWKWDFWRTSRSCRVTRVRGLQEVLKWRFGDGWNPPRTSVNVG